MSFNIERRNNGLIRIIYTCASWRLDVCFLESKWNIWLINYYWPSERWIWHYLFTYINMQRWICFIFLWSRIWQLCQWKIYRTEENIIYIKKTFYLLSTVSMFNFYAIVIIYPTSLYCTLIAVTFYSRSAVQCNKYPISAKYWHMMTQCRSLYRNQRNGRATKFNIFESLNQFSVALYPTRPYFPKNQLIWTVLLVRVQQCLSFHQIRLRENYINLLFKYPKRLDYLQKKNIHDLLLHLISRGFQPFSIVEDIGFEEYSHALNSAYTLPSRKTLSNILLPSKFEEVPIKTRIIKICKIGLPIAGHLAIRMDLLR